MAKTSVGRSVIRTQTEAIAEIIEMVETAAKCRTIGGFIINHAWASASLAEAIKELNHPLIKECTFVQSIKESRPHPLITDNHYVCNEIFIQIDWM